MAMTRENPVLLQDSIDVQAYYDDDYDDDVGAVVGISIGVIVGICIFVFLGCYFWKNGAAILAPSPQASPLAEVPTSPNRSSPAPVADKKMMATIFKDKLETPPSKIMEKIFQIQGINCFVPDIKLFVEKLAKIVQDRITKAEAKGIPKQKYDCFLNYRVATDAATAEKLFLNLKLLGLNPFFDKESLSVGEDWKDGFLRGLAESNVFVALISADALAPVRDVYRDHTKDNVLLEYQMALAINDARKVAEQPEFIVPVLVAKTEGGGHFPFHDFKSSDYSDSITAKQNVMLFEK